MSQSNPVCQPIKGPEPKCRSSCPCGINVNTNCPQTPTIPAPPSFAKCKVPIDQPPSTPFYYEISQLRPCQASISCLNVKNKFDKIIKKNNAVWNGCEYILRYNDQTSPYPLDDAFPVVISPYGFILENGTHHVVAALEVQATTVPIQIIGNYSAFSKKKFEKLFYGKYFFPYANCGPNQRVTLPCTLNPESLIEFSNRYFAIISARDCESVSTPNDETTGNDYPLWIQIGGSKGYFQFEIAEALTRSGLVYCNKWGDDIPEAFMEAARQVLIENPIDGLCLITERTYYKDIPDLCGQCG